MRHEGRANPNQLLMADHTLKGLAQLRSVLIDAHRQTTGSEDGLLIGLQLTHSGRYCRPTAKLEPRILYQASDPGQAPGIGAGLSGPDRWRN